jgi:hypothetical protein
MTTTNAFFEWFFYGVSGLGGWFIFLLFALAAVIWMFYDSGNRRLPALGWRMSTLLTGLLILPAILYRFTTNPLDPFTSPLAPFAEPIFYLGVLGGLVPLVLAVGYYVTFQGMLGCPRGMHPAYESILGQCPECTRIDMPKVDYGGGGARRDDRGQGSSGGGYVPSEPDKPKVAAWLVGRKNYQLCAGETTIGRSADNDIYLSGDNTISRQHAKIIQQGQHFKLHQIGTTGMTKVNGRTVREPVLLEADDEIRFGDNTVLRFKK